MPSKRASHTAALTVLLAGVTAALHIGKIPPAIPVLRDDLGLTLVEAGFLLSLVQLAGMLLGALLGVAADAFGLRRSMLTGLLTLSLASFAGMWARAPVDLLVLRAVEGLGFLLVVLSAPSLIQRLVPPRQLPWFLGLWGSYMPAGAALALLCGSPFMALLGWQAWWGVLGGLSSAMAVWVVVAVPAVSPTPAGASGAAPGPAAMGWTQRLRMTLASPGPWLVALAFALYSSQWLAVVGFLPSVYAQAGIGPVAAGALTAWACAMNITGNVAAGRLLHHGWCARRLLFLGFGSMALTAFLTFSALLGDAPWWRYLAVLLFSAIGGLIPGTLFSLAVRLAPNAQTVSTTVGWMLQCSASGQCLGPPLVAWVAAQAGSWQWTWVVTGLASLLGLWLASRVPPSPGPASLS